MAKSSGSTSNPPTARAPAGFRLPRPPVTAANLISLSRLLLLAPLWLFAARGAGRLTAALIVVALFTDFLDGFVARRTTTATHFGAVLDSLADNLLMISATVWLYWLQPEIIHNHPVWVGVYLGALAAVYVVMAVKFRRNVGIHTYASKIGNVVFWLFLVHALVFGYERVFFYLTMVTSYYYLAEDLYLLLTRPEIDEHVRSFLSP